ncbi:MAG: PorV/PorQ family protein [Candidatus Hydrogenedentota bacterium]
MKRFKFFIVILLSSASILKSGTPNGASFLEMVTHPRPAALGEAYVAAGDDVYSLTYNPSASAIIKTPELGAAYLNLFDEINLNSFSIVYPFMDRFAVGGDIFYFSFDDIRRDENGTANGELSVNSFAVTLNGAFKITDYLAAGANVRWLREDFDVVSGTTVGFDLGALLKVPLYKEYGELKGGIAIRNIGPDIDLGNASDNLPLTAAVGLSYKILDSLLFTAEYQYEDDDSYNLGVEYVWAEMLSLRMGARFDSRQPDDSRLRFGCGFKYPRFGALDYTYEDQENFGAMHRISYRYIFREQEKTPTIGSKYRP